MSAPDASSATSSLPVSVPGLGTATGALQGSVSNLINLGHGVIDKYFPPDKRQAWKDWLVKFATERPRLAAFLLSQLALSGPAIALFILMTITVVVFSLLAGILVGLIGALLFIVAAVGFALIILLPTLFFTTGAGVFFWLWGMGTYYIIKWFNEKPVPGVNTDLKGGLADASGLSDLPGINGEPLKDEDNGKKSESKSSTDENPEKPARQKHEGKSTGSNAQHHADGKENSAAQRTSKKAAAAGGD